MRDISEIKRQESRLVIGIMSGTSADGVDTALCRIHGHGLYTKVEQLSFLFTPFDHSVREEILRLAGGGKATAADFCQMNFLLGKLYADAAEKMCQYNDVNKEDIDLIGSHGQTFWHIPVPETYLGKSLQSTLQLGECAVLAERFGCPAIGDFRVRDIAAGGLGAPLVPYSEYLLYRSTTESVALQNIGGIGNITYLPPSCRMEDIYAFDTGPGNMLIDAICSFVTDGKQEYDEGGAIAAKGHVISELLSDLMKDPYLERKPPKTTGREYFGKQYVERILKDARERNVAPVDLLATVTRFTAETIAYSIEHYLPNMPDRLIVGGGGAMNHTLMSMIQAAVPRCRVITNEECGYDSNAKEAVAFAVLANEALFEGTNNVPNVTGASHPVVMGKISI